MQIIFESPKFHEIPDFAETTNVQRKILLECINEVIKRFKNKGIFPKDKNYADLYADLNLLSEFIKNFKVNMKVAEDMLVDLNGNKISDEKTILKCGINLEQLCRIMVFTAFRRLVNNQDKEQIKLMQAIAPYIAFDWQIPLLGAYLNNLNSTLVETLGESILDLKNENNMIYLKEKNARDIKRVKDIVGDKFAELINNNPNAVKTISACGQHTYALLQEFLSSRLWELFEKGENTVHIIAHQDKEILKFLGEDLASISPEVFSCVDRFNPTRKMMIFEELKKEYKENFRLLLSDEEFIKTEFKKMTDYLLESKDTDDFVQIIRVKLAALKDIFDKNILKLGGKI